jgi:3',5'-cyclic AMP phosphodiesterase CpdA
MTRIAHLSDLHLNGSLDRFNRTIGSLRQAASMGATYLLLTGDLTKNGSEDRVRELGSALFHWPHRATIVPGNHDAGSFSESASRWLGRFEATSRPETVVDLGDVLIAPVDTRFAKRSFAFQALGRVSVPQLLVLSDLALRASAAKPAIVAMHHGPIRSPLGAFEGLTNWKQVYRALSWSPHVSVCCGHDHRALDLGRVHAAASLATHDGDPLRLYDVRGGQIVPVYRSREDGAWWRLGAVPAEVRR